jgi:hypothetical protein
MRSNFNAFVVLFAVADEDPFEQLDVLVLEKLDLTVIAVKDGSLLGYQDCCH